ncbi:MAG: DUF4349 domain-containing protein [Erysipelotrichaceae bacterium]|nr:DUF4349 domain-containing protein [Erysipelotrichaceae bacterium]
MKKEKIIDAMNDIDDKYIQQAHQVQNKKSFFSFDLVGKLAIAAVCLALIVAVVPSIMPKMGSNNAKEEYIESYDAVADMEMAEENGYSDIGSGDADYITNATDIYENNKKLIVTGNLAVETDDFDNYLNSLKNKVESVGGYFQSSSIDIFDNEQRYYYATIRIPAQEYNNFLSSVKENVNVTNYNEYVDDITDTYTDLKARQESLKAEENKILEFYDQATNIDELMEIESRLTDIRYEIDYLESRIKNYDTLTNYSTLNINISESKVYTKNVNFFERLGSQFVNGLNNFANVIQDILLSFAYNFLQIVLIVIAVVVIIKVVKKIINK